MGIAETAQYQTQSAINTNVDMLRTISTLYNGIDYPASGDEITRIRQAWKLNPCLTKLPNGELCNMPADHQNKRHAH